MLWLFDFEGLLCICSVGVGGGRSMKRCVSLYSFLMISSCVAKTNSMW